MAGTPGRLTRRVLAVLAGAAFGIALLAGGVTLVQRSAPPVYNGHVLFVLKAADGVEVNAPALRAELAQKLADPAYLTRLVSSGRVSMEAATRLRESLSLNLSAHSEAVLTLSARSGDAPALAEALDAIASALVDDLNNARVLRLDARLSEIETLTAAFEASDAAATAALADVRLPTWARARSLTLGRLDGEAFGLDLRQRLGELLTPAMRETRASLRERIAEIERTTGGEPSVLTEHLLAARELASIDWKRSHLLRARLDAEQALVAPPPLRIVQRAQTAREPLHYRRIGWAGLIGGALGALGVFVAGLGRPKVTAPTRDGPTLEANLSVRVIGSMPAALGHFAARNAAPLASVQPNHLALASVRSLGTALALVGAAMRRDGPVIAADIDRADHAGHALANLAVCLADAGRRVLVVDAGREGGVLEAVLQTGTDVERADKRDDADASSDEVASVGSKAAGSGRGRIRFVVARHEENDPEPPVPGVFMHYFDCVLIRTDRAEHAARLAQLYDGSRGVLAAHHNLPIRSWQAARKAWRDAGDMDTLVGLIHGGHALHEHLYVSVD